jgi:hypothetical protein
MQGVYESKNILLEEKNLGADANIFSCGFCDSMEYVVISEIYIRASLEYNEASVGIPTL